MLTFEQNGAKEWSVIRNEEVIPLELVPSSVTNKYYIIINFLKNMSEEFGDEFDNWFFEFLKGCTNKKTRQKTVVDNVPMMKEFADKYIDRKKIDFSQFVDESKAKKDSILFSEEDIEKIIKLSSAMKIYSVVSNNEKFRLGQKMHRDVYNKIAGEILTTDIVQKIFDIVRTKTFTYNKSDKYMWEYIKTTKCKPIGVHVIEIFNFIMNSILVLCEEDKNPIVYFLGVIDESVKWFLRSVYKGTIVYDDSVSTEDIHDGKTLDNLKNFSYNDTLGRMKGIAFEKIYETIEKQKILAVDDQQIDLDPETDEAIVNFHNRLVDIEFISPLTESLVYPVLSQISTIPFDHFKTLSAEHAAVLSFYCGMLLKKVFKGEYKNLFQLLDFYPLNNPSISTTYKVKLVHDYLSAQKKFYGFNAKMTPYNLLCHFVGRISRITFCNIVDGKKMTGIPLSKIETDMIHFYTKFFAGEFKDKIDEMTQIMNKDF